MGIDFVGNYPPGAEHDPRAPYNQADDPGIYGMIHEGINITVRERDISFNVHAEFKCGEVSELIGLEYVRHTGKTRKLNVKAPGVAAFFDDYILPVMLESDLADRQAEDRADRARALHDEWER